MIFAIKNEKTQLKYTILMFQYLIFIAILMFLIIFPNIANAASSGMGEFAKIGEWIQQNLQGTLGFSLSMLSILVLAFGFMTNPSKTLMIPPAALLTTIWLAPTIIENLFR